MSFFRPLQRANVKARALVSRFRTRADGVAAVEFALILPIMFLLMVGSVELSQAVTADRRTSQIASSVGDLVARATSDLPQTEVHDITKIGSWLLKPFKDNPLKITISMVTAPCPPTGPCSGPSPYNNPNQKMRWTCTYETGGGGFNCTCPKTYYEMPSAGGLLNYGDGVVVSNVEYKYDPYFMSGSTFVKFVSNNANFSGGLLKLTDTLYFKPRGTCVKLTAVPAVPGNECSCFD